MTPTHTSSAIALAVVCAASIALAAADRPQETIIPQATANGSELFRMYCASCHGTSARGDGPLAASMRHRPPNLTELRKRNHDTYSRELVFRIIDGREKVAGHGGPDMPVWGDAFRHSLEGGNDDAIRARIEALVDYLEIIQVR